MVTYAGILNDAALQTYIQKSNDVLGAMGYTDHGPAHMALTAERAGSLLETLGYPPRDCELARMAAAMHDIGNCVNRHNHALTGGCLAFTILERLGVPPEEIADIVGAIGHHDEDTGRPISPLSAALILSDKSDVRRTRVRGVDPSRFDIHDRVNYAVLTSSLDVLPEEKVIRLTLKVDTAIAPIVEYFEIFTARMTMCRRAAEYLGMSFHLTINEVSLL